MNIWYIAEVREATELRQVRKREKKCSKHIAEEKRNRSFPPPLSPVSISLSLYDFLFLPSRPPPLSLSLSFFRFTLIFSFSLFVCLSLQLGNCPRYFRIHRNATIADMHCRDDGKGGQWVIFHTLFAKM